MIQSKRLVASLGTAVLAMLMLSAVAQAKTPADPAAPGRVTSAVRQVTNGILTIQLEDTTGQWTVVTGASHPHPNAQVIFPIGTSYITLRDATSSEMWNNGGASSAGLTGYTLRSMLSAPATLATTNLGTTGFRTTYTLPSWTVVQDVILNGTTLGNTNVQHTVTVTNTTGTARTYGVRTMWDWEINGNDASVFRTRNPDGVFTSTFATFTNPSFQLFEEVDNAASPTFSVFGTIGGSALSPAPTQPEQLRYSGWGIAQTNAWDFTNTGSGIDSATEYYWGFATPLNLGAGASASYTQYLTTQLSAVGGGSSGPLLVPTMSEWGMILMIALVGGLAMWSMRRRNG